jgi:hypothetical protein
VTCKDLLALRPLPSTGEYEVDPDGPGGEGPFTVRCEMTKAGGGWTLVALERQGVTETLRFLGFEQGTPDHLLQNQSAIIGVRFKGHYTAVRIEWNTNEYIQFNLSGAEIFDNTANTDLAISDLDTSSNDLTNWVMIAGGAKLCRAAVSPNIQPGDTSWAIKPNNDNNTACGCSNMNWTGQGAYYGGTPIGCTTCSCWQGSFAGVKDNNQPKSVVTNYDTRIYIR